MSLNPVDWQARDYTSHQVKHAQAIAKAMEYCGVKTELNYVEFSYADFKQSLMGQMGASESVAQNIYLAAASMKLGTVMIARITHDEIEKQLPLKEGEKPVYIMPVGK